MAIDYAVNYPKSCRSVTEMTNKEREKVRQTNRRCLIKIIENLQCLCRQGLAVQVDIWAIYTNENKPRLK